MSNLGLLSPDAWAGEKNPERRLQALQELWEYNAAENHLQVGKVSMTQMEEGIRGAYDPNSKSYTISADLVNAETPYNAVENVFHESRHATQQGMSEGLVPAENLREFRDNKAAFNGGYIPHQLSSELYRAQPTEVDARIFARGKTDAFYQDLAGEQGYQKYADKRVQDEIQNNEYSKQLLGDDINEVARQEVRERCVQQHPELADELGVTPQSQTNQTSLEQNETPQTPIESPRVNEPAVSEDQDQEKKGHGYSM